MTWTSLEQMNQRGAGFAVVICVLLSIASFAAEFGFSMSGDALASGVMRRLVWVFRSS